MAITALPLAKSTMTENCNPLASLMTLRCLIPKGPPDPCSGIYQPVPWDPDHEEEGERSGGGWTILLIEYVTPSFLEAEGDFSPIMASPPRGWE